MDVALLEDWCKGMDLDPRKALLIVGIPMECNVAEINDIVKASLHSLGTCRVIGRMFRREDSTKAALIELSEIVDYAMVPSQIMGNGIPWEVVVRPRTPDDEFLNRLKSFLKDEGRRMADVAKILGHSTGSMKSKGQCKPEGGNTLSESTWYRKLKLFSGSAFPGQGEEPFDSWLEQATEIMQTWQVSDGEKRRRLLESLRGSALSIMRVLRASNDSITVEQCLDALKQIFGTKEDCRISQFRLLQCSRRPAEKLSAYLLRLEPLLQKVVAQSPLPKRSSDTIRLKHVLAQVSITPALKGKLTLLDQRECPPTFLELMKLTRDEEEWEMAAMVMEKQQKQVEKAHQDSENQDNQDTTQTESYQEISTQTVKPEMTMSVKRRRLLSGNSTAEEGYMEEGSPRNKIRLVEQKLQVSLEELGNERGVGTVSRLKPQEI
uniref:paraneoplastic antigen-like protein 5 n=1 Tax=Jaculus jaculus TaxID=51337 RepID=UPI001E1B30E1|nr:paraneoplastic antigen-like protein 5 [Jaculus jaculus]